MNFLADFFCIWPQALPRSRSYHASHALIRRARCTGCSVSPPAVRPMLPHGSWAKGCRNISAMNSGWKFVSARAVT